MSDLLSASSALMSPSTLSAMELSWLQQRITAVMKSACTLSNVPYNETITTKWQQNVFREYQTGRHYHDLRHIHAMLNKQDEAFGEKQLGTGSELINATFEKNLQGTIQLSEKEKVWVRLATIFHDYVYQGKPTDELRSIEAFKEFARETGLNFDKQSMDTISWLIRLTIEHQIPSGELPISKEAAEVMSDTDMVVLSWDWGCEDTPGTYAYYRGQVAMEYVDRNRDDPRWLEGRTDFLRGTLATEWIFQSQLFREAHEEDARKNMRRELTELEERIEELKSQEGG